MRAPLRGLVLGVAFGVAVSIVDLGFMAMGVIARRMGPGLPVGLQIAGLEIALAGLLGLAAAPLLWLRVRRPPPSFFLLLAVALAWLGLGKLVEFEAPLGRIQMLSSPVAAFVLTLIGLGLARWRTWVPWALGAFLIPIGAAGPMAYVDATSEPHVPRAELPPAPEGAPDVVLIVLDTVRAESLSAYGYERGTSPVFAELAKEGAIFSDATSPSTWSLPSHASLFTGRYPSSHGAHGESVQLDDTYPTLAQVLAARGYETFCFTSNAWISDGLGLTRGFGWQDASWRNEVGAGRNFSFIFRLLDYLELAGGDKGGALVAQHFADWRADRPADARPSFVFLNFIEAHFPYHQLPDGYLSKYTDRPHGELEDISMALMGQQFGGPGRELADVQQPAIDMYDGGILYTDELLRRVVEAVRERGTLDRTILVVLADHGEIMGEKAGYFGHGPSLYQQVVSVPLLVRYPPGIPAGARVDAPVSTVGVFATILDLANIEVPPTLHVGSLAPQANGAAGSAGPVLAERMKVIALGGAARQTLSDPQMSGMTRYRAFRSGSWKLVQDSTGGTYLYDLASDPGESRELSSERPDQLGQLRGELEAVRARLDLPPLDADLASPAASPDLDEATQQRLRELGYIE